MATANLNDMATLATDPVFGNRVLSALILYCGTTVLNEAITAASVAQHNARKNYASQVLNNPTFYKPLFVNVVSVNQIVANEATATGTIVGQTGATLATSALLCLDSDINNAVAAAFNAFIAGI
jgi:ATP-dependent exoDNAse (exonuclease V) beta subunit